uniref:FERM domain-containing protein n=1 Tax=Angiostrongylus cantonensis TaxID=6313 RepID=A0A0K0D6V8_ANGCA
MCYFWILPEMFDKARDYCLLSIFATAVESYPETSSNISLNVFLGDGYKIGMKCALSLCTDDVMKKIAKQLQIDNSERFLQMFGLFLARPRDDSSNHVDGQFNMLVVRLLRNFESPYATLQTANRQSAIHGVCYKLVIRKMIWDPRVEQTLLGDAVFVDLLYRQAKSDLQNGFFSISSESIAEDLRILEADDDKLQVRSGHF